MGGCYSAESHKALTSPKHKQPKRNSVKQNGRATDNGSITNGKPAPNGSDVPIQKSENFAEGHSAPTAVLAEIVPSCDESNEKQAKGVAPSDSGIESIGTPQDEVAPEPQPTEFTLCQSCHQKLRRISRGSCHQCGNFQIDTSELSALKTAGNTYCTCGPRVIGKQSACRTHRPKGVSDPSYRHSDVMGMVLKSNLKKQGHVRGGEGKQVRMSWKSADSLDMRTTMITCMDRTKSEASEIFGDDVSFRAPLAQFDSVECQLDADDAVLPDSRMSIYSEILNLADCICKCDFTSTEATASVAAKSHSQTHPETTPAVLEVSESMEFSHAHSVGVSESTDLSSQCVTKTAASPLRSASTPDSGRLLPGGKREKEEDGDSGRGASKSEGHSESVSGSDLDTGEESDRLLSAQSSPRRRDLGLEEDINWTELADNGVCPVTVKGRQLVMMNEITYTQMLNDLALLREQLSHLTQVIKEEESIGILDFSLTVDD